MMIGCSSAVQCSRTGINFSNDLYQLPRLSSDPTKWPAWAVGLKRDQLKAVIITSMWSWILVSAAAKWLNAWVKHDAVSAWIFMISAIMTTWTRDTVRIFLHVVEVRYNMRMFINARSHGYLYNLLDNSKSEIFRMLLIHRGRGNPFDKWNQLAVRLGELRLLTHAVSKVVFKSVDVIIHKHSEHWKVLVKEYGLTANHDKR